MYLENPSKNVTRPQEEAIMFNTVVQYALWEQMLLN